MLVIIRLSLIQILIFFPTIIHTTLGQIIVLQGVSSSGKTSIAKELALQLKTSKITVMDYDAYLRSIIIQKALEIGYDLNESKYIWAQDFYIVTKHLSPEKRKQIFLQMLTSFFERIKNAALSGKIVLVDSIAPQDTPLFLQYMGNITITTVLLYTPIDTIITFIQNKNNSATSEYDKRSLLISLQQYPYYFKPAMNNNFFVDTLHLSKIQKYFKYINKEIFWYIPKSTTFEPSFLQHFQLDQMSSIQITPIMPYDIIMYQSELSISKRAQVLKRLLKI